jgi:arylamine N-acetyltransferase
VTNRFLADVGFAGTNSLAPLSMDTTEAQTLVDGVFRVTAGDDGWYTASSQLNGVWRDLYTFRDEPTSHIDLELSNWCAQCPAATTFGARHTTA